MEKVKNDTLDNETLDNAFNKQIKRDATYIGVILFAILLILFNDTDKTIGVLFLGLTSYVALVVFLTNLYIFSNKRKIIRWHAKDARMGTMHFNDYRLPTVFETCIKNRINTIPDKEFSEFKNTSYIFPFLFFNQKKIAAQ